MDLDKLNWLVILKTCGVQTPEATVWAPLFAAAIRPGTFSLGGAELDLFLGNALHETGMLRKLSEGLSYSADRIRELGNASKPGTRWRSLVPLADKLARNPQAMANAAYGGRLGNTEPNDGWDYRGSGIIQLTGKANFAAMQKITGLPLLKNPGLLRTPTVESLKVCIAWWEGNVPDSVMASPRKVRTAVNGGDFGLDETIRISALAKKALQATA